MCKEFGKKSFKLLLAGLCFSFVCAGQGFSAKPKSEMIKEEEGFYYGYGTGSTTEAACAVAKKDLIETSLTSVLREKNPAAPRVLVSEDSVNERLAGINPIFPKKKNKNEVVYKISIKEWEKDSKAFEDKLRKSLTPLYEKITVKGSSASKLDTAAEILGVLADKGEADLLTLQAGGTELFSRKVEAVCQSILNNLVISVETPNGIVTSETVFKAHVQDKAGKAVENLTLKAVWEIPALAIAYSFEEIPEVVSIVNTDSEGNAEISFPVAEEFNGKIVCLTVSTALSNSKTATSEMKKIDASGAAEAHYVYFQDMADAFKSVDVAAGEYKTGAVAQDRRATSKEAARTVTLGSYAIDLAPVTNAQYAAYLYATNAETYPEYFDNSDYNQDNQPVIGVSAKDAEAYAAWLSAQTGNKYRLPTDDEWEVAARAGTENIYPWGDESADKVKAANCRKNGQFDYTSPVGSFMNGANSWGLVDMAGNVWEWTSTTRNCDEGQRTVKGGSWMDGPADLRISNFKNIDSEMGTEEVGFRLVKEISNEKE